MWACCLWARTTAWSACSRTGTSPSVPWRRAGGPDTKVGEAMTPEVRYCFEDEELDDVVDNMGENKVRRLPVMSRDKRLVGIVSFSDVALYGDSEQADTAVTAVSEPGGPHSQSS